MERLLKKGFEFYQCAQHINMRGMAAVIEECKPIVADLKAQGKTKDDLLAFFTEKNGGEAVNLEKDKFLNLVVGLWTMEGASDGR